MPIIECFRSITFVIPGVDGAPGVQVTAVENGGTLEFTVEVLTTGGVTADLRGLFFDVANLGKLTDLTPVGAEVNGFDTEDVINHGRGANMHGRASPFDVGIEFGTPGKGKDDIQTATFVLSNGAGDLTLDDIANVEFGARLTSVGEQGGRRNDSAKLVTIAPAAPDAVDDSYDIFEDGQSGLGDPSSVSEPVLFQVLDNDTDADGDTLTITDVFGASNGTVQIVDGDDADLLPGDAILYSPDTDYSGPDGFTYKITDNNGGADFAHVDVMIEAVADIPDVSIEAFATDDVNVIRLVVTATQTDDDNSEFIDQILSSALPVGVSLSPAGTIDPATTPTQLVQEYFLTLPLDQDTDFGLTFTAVSEELSNGDQETGTDTIQVFASSQSNESIVSFRVEDDNPFQYSDLSEFRGATTGGRKPVSGSDADPTDPEDTPTVTASAWVDFAIGIEEDFDLDSGKLSMDLANIAEADTFYNGVTDILQINTTSNQFGNWILSDPLGNVDLSAVAKLDVDASVSADLEVGTLTLSLSELAAFLGQPIPKFDIDETFLSFNNDTLPEGSFEFPSVLDFISISYQSPEDMSGLLAPVTDVTDFLKYDFDLDEFFWNTFEFVVLPSLATKEGLAIAATQTFFDANLNPLNLEASIPLTGLFMDIEIADFDINLDWKLERTTDLELDGMLGTINFEEDGESKEFVFGDTLIFKNASEHDLNGDGIIEYTIDVVQEGSLLHEANLNPLGDFISKSLSLKAGYKGIFGEFVATIEGETIDQVTFDIGDSRNVFSGSYDFDPKEEMAFSSEVDIFA